MNKETNQENLRNQILDLLDVLKAKEIKTLDITTKSSFADFLIICEGTSSRHVSSIVNKISRDLKKNVHSVEGLPVAEWALIDFGDIILHVFKPDVRKHYNLEKIWSELTPNEKKSFG